MGYKIEEPNTFLLSMEDRFWGKVDKTDSCWLWTAGKTTSGYGQFYVDVGNVPVHRLSWILSGNDIPDGHVIRHKCRNRHCCNPDHLETGTPAENMADMIRDGTSTRGAKNPSVKLTEEQVRQIRARAGEKSQRLLAEEYGVSQRTISNIIHRRIWSWLE